MNKKFTRWLLCMLVCMFSSATWALDPGGWCLSDRHSPGVG